MIRGVKEIRDGKNLTFPLSSIYAPLNYESSKIKCSAFQTINLKLTVSFTVRNAWNLVLFFFCLESGFPKSPQVAPPLLLYGSFTLKHTLFISLQSKALEAILVTTCNASTFGQIWDSNGAAVATAGKRMYIWKSVGNAFFLAWVNIPPGSRYPFQLGYMSLRGWSFCTGDLSNSMHGMLQLFRHKR